MIKVDLNCLDPGNVHLNNLNAPVLNVLMGRAIPLISLCAFMACYMVNFTSFTHLQIILPIRIWTRNLLLVRAAATFCNFFKLEFSYDSVLHQVQHGLQRKLGLIPDSGNNFYLLQISPTSSRTHLASYLMGQGGIFSRSKAAGAWSWPLTSSAEMKN